MTSLPFAFLLLVGISFLALSVCIVIKQHKAKQCELHNRAAGQAAIVLAVVCAFIGFALLATIAVILQRAG